MEGGDMNCDQCKNQGWYGAAKFGDKEAKICECRSGLVLKKHLERHAKPSGATEPVTVFMERFARDMAT